MASSYYIQYHNADNLGRYPSDDLDFNTEIDSLIIDNSVKYQSWIYTSKKSIENSIEDYCFLIVGKTEMVKKYYLWSYFRIEDFEIDDNKEYNVFGYGYNFEHPILLNDLEGFNDFKHYCGNFGLGFQNIEKHAFCEKLRSFSSESYILDNIVDIEFPSTQQYQDVISKALSPTQVETLQTLFYFPNSSATAKELAKALNYKSYHAANRQVGQIGKVISQNTGIIPPPYKGKKGDQPAYFFLVGEYYKDTGWEMWEELRQALINLKLVEIDTAQSIERLPTEVLQFEETKLLKEGKVVQVTVNRYERNEEARQKCIEHYGVKCFACGFDFGRTYGDIAKGFIHVHHLIPLAEIKEQYDVDPIKDLVPLCPNCHSVIHLRKPAMTIEQLKGILVKGK